MEGVLFAVTQRLRVSKCWLLTARTVRELIELLRCREAVAFRLFVHDLRLILARAFNGWLLAIITGRTVLATGLTVTRSAVARTTALGRRRAGAGACAGAGTVLATTGCDRPEQRRALRRAPGRRPRLWLFWYGPT